MRRIFLLSVSLVLLVGSSHAQPQSGYRRVLVSPTEEIIPLGDGESAADRIGELTTRPPNSSRPNGACTDKFMFGYHPDDFQTTVLWGARHRDVIAQWFTMPATGSVDTIFWSNTQVGTTDSTVNVRVYNSAIGPDYGPGARPGPFNPPCQYWGYWTNTNDADHGVAAFPEDATDTAWISTIEGTAAVTRPPMAGLRWGAQGYLYQMKPNATNFVAMDWIGDTIGVTAGERLFIALELPPCRQDSPHCETEPLTYWRGSSFEVGGADDPEYPSRNWKFYSHGTYPSGCYGIMPYEPTPGWIARGGFSRDSFRVAVVNIWYSMTVETNVPPAISGAGLHPPFTFDTTAKDLALEVVDCNPADPKSAGVSSVILRLTVNGVPRAPIPFTNVGADVWEGTLPGFQPTSEVTYAIVTSDFDGDSTVSRGEYTVAPYGSDWYGIVPDSCVLDNDISATGQEIDPMSFMDSTGLAVDRDNGIAGPIDMGNLFTVFGEEYRFAWVSVNGAISLTRESSPAPSIDTIGHSGTFWLEPCEDPSCVPGQFIAPYRADHVLGGGTFEYGRILYRADSCRFIVQWDSMGAMVDGEPRSDNTTFRVVLNRCDGSVEFEYESVGFHGLEFTNISGMQGDSGWFSGPSSGHVFYNKWGYPAETRLSNYSCTRFYPTIRAVAAEEGWNLISLPGRPLDGDYSTKHLFPAALSRAFYHDGHEYIAVDSLEPGRGYYLKFEEVGYAGSVPSTLLRCVTAPVHAGWNMIGAAGAPTPAADVVESGMAVTSSYFGHGPSGWYVADELWPGMAYWVKTDGAGELVICSDAGQEPREETVRIPDLKRLSSLRIEDASGRSQSLYLGTGEEIPGPMLDLPPRPPAKSFDLRFSSGGMAAALPAEVGDQPELAEQVILLQGVTLPLNLSWTFQPGVELDLYGNHRGTPPGDPPGTPLGGRAKIATLTGTGSVVITSGGGSSDLVSSLGLRRTQESTLPAGFSIAQNFPNPFNPLTTIVYELPIASRVAIRVYDVLGKEVGVLVDETKDAGRHSVSWDGSAMPSGVYYCRMTAGSFSDGRKLLLIR